MVTLRRMVRCFKVKENGATALMFRKMKKTIRIITLTLLFCMSVSLFIGCGKTDDGNANSADNSSSGTVENSSVNFSLGIDSNGLFDGIEALDYVTLPDGYKGFEVSESLLTVSQDEIDEFVETVRQNSGVPREVTDRACEIGDAVNIDYSGTVDGVVFNGGTAEAVDITLGSSGYIDGFDDQVVGHKVGENFDIYVTFPEGYGDATDADGNVIQMSGTDAVFNITLNSISEYVMTDDSVAVYFGDDYTMLDGTKITTIAQIEDYFIERQRYNAIEQEIYYYLVENSEVAELPEDMLELQYEVDRQYVAYSAAQNGYDDVDVFLAAYGYENMDAYIEAIKADVLESVSWSMIVQAIAEQDGYEADDDVMKEFFGSEVDNAVTYYGEGYARQLALNYIVLLDLAMQATITK